MSVQQLSYSDAVDELARALNDLAPVVEAAQECASMNQALGDIGKIFEAFDPVARAWMELRHIQSLIKDNGYVIKPESL